MDTGKQTTEIVLKPIGVTAEGDGYWLEIAEEYRPGLAALDQFSHVIVLWWAHGHDNEQSRKMLQCQPPYAEGTVTGVFACRAEYRPNPIAVTVCKLLQVDMQNGRVELEYLDAHPGTPVLDLKAYFPVSDRVRDISMPVWVQDWPEWVEDAHLLAW